MHEVSTNRVQISHLFVESYFDTGQIGIAFGRDSQSFNSDWLRAQDLGLHDDFLNHCKRWTNELYDIDLRLKQ